MATCPFFGRRSGRIFRRSIQSPLAAIWSRTGPGHERRKPTTLATSMEVLLQLGGLRGEPSQPADTHSDNELKHPKDGPVGHLVWNLLWLRPSNNIYKCWTARSQHVSAVLGTRRKGPSMLHYDRWMMVQDNIMNKISMQSLQSDILRPLEDRTECPQDHVPNLHQHQDFQSQQALKVRALGCVALGQWRRHYLNDHLPVHNACVLKPGANHIDVCSIQKLSLWVWTSLASFLLEMINKSRDAATWWLGVIHTQWPETANLFFQFQDSLIKTPIIHYHVLTWTCQRMKRAWGRKAICLMRASFQKRRRRSIKVKTLQQSSEQSPWVKHGCDWSKRPLMWQSDNWLLSSPWRAGRSNI